MILNHGEQVKGTSGAYIIHSFIVHFLSDLLRFVGSACEGETTTHRSLHLILCFEECSPSVTLNCEVIFTQNSFFGKFIEHFLF